MHSSKPLMATTDWTALRGLASVALERTNERTASTKVFKFDERDVVSGHADAEKCGVRLHFFLLELYLMRWHPGCIPEARK